MASVDGANLDVRFELIYIFLTTNNNNDNIYCECRGRMFNFLNNSRHDTVTNIHHNS
jgi:hypothetical protein